MRNILIGVLLLGISCIGCVKVHMVKDTTGLKEIKYSRWWGSQEISGFEMKKDGSVKFSTQKADSGMPWQTIENMSAATLTAIKKVP